MELKLAHADQFVDSAVDRAASAAGCIANIKWWMPHGARFILIDKPMSDEPATFEQHDQVIKSLLEKYPDARIRTARATFEGLADWEAQRAARVA